MFLWSPPFNVLKRRGAEPVLQNTIILKITIFWKLWGWLIHYTVCAIDPSHSLCCWSITQPVLLIHYTACAVDPLHSLCCWSITQPVLLIHYTACAVDPLHSLCCWSITQSVLLIHYTVCAIDPFNSLCCWSCLWVWLQSSDVPADVRFLQDKDAVLRDMIKGTLCTSMPNTAHSSGILYIHDVKLAYCSTNVFSWLVVNTQIFTFPYFKVKCDCWHKF